MHCACAVSRFDPCAYDVSAEGSRFVVLAADEDMLTHVTLVFSFFDEVRRILAGR